MNEILHIARKDARHLRGPLIAWTLLVAGDTALNIARPALDLQGFGAALVARQLASLTSFVGLVLMVLLVSWLVHEDSAVDRDAFWLTRPFNVRRLVAAKLAVGSAALIVVPLAGALITMAAFHIRPLDRWRAAPPIVLEQAIWFLGLTAGATLTSSMTRYAILLAGAIAAFVVIWSAVFAGVLLFIDVEPSAPRQQIADSAPTVLSAAFAMAAFLWVIFRQYRHRQARAGAAIALAGVLVAVAISMFWHSRLGRLPEPDPGAWARDERQVEAVRSPDPPQVSEAMTFLERKEPTKQITLRIRLSGVPPDMFVQAVETTSRLELDGVAIGGTQVSMGPGPGTSEPSREQLSVVTALGNVRLLGLEEKNYSDPWPVVLALTDQQFGQYARTPGRLVSSLDFHLARTIAAGAMPLRSGETLRDDDHRIEIAGIVRRTDGCTVVLRETSINPLLRRRVLTNDSLVLRNAARGEAIEGGLESMEGGASSPLWFVLSLGMGSGSVEAATSERTGFGVRTYTYRYPARGTSTTAPLIDAAWLDGAELVRIRKSYAGHVSRSLTIDDFRMVR
jgi:hypothetical protein